MTDDSSGRIAGALRRAVRAMPPGTRLPSTRALMAAHSAGPATIQRAVHALVREGLVETQPGVGTFVLGRRQPRLVDYSWQTVSLGQAPWTGDPVGSALRTAPPDAIALHSGYPDAELLPVRLVQAALARAARGDAATMRSPAAGQPDLQSWFARDLAARTLPTVVPPRGSDVIIVPGSQCAIAAAFRALASPGQAVVMESPTYWGAIMAARHAGLRIVPVPAGSGAPDPAALDRALAASGARLVYAQPSFANPTGACWRAAEADAVLQVLRVRGAFLVEDDWAHDFGIDADPAPVAARDDAGHVIYLRSLTKSVSPALRVAALIARGPVRERLLAGLALESMYVSPVLQSAALEVVGDPRWATHRRALRQGLRERRDLLVAALGEHAPLAALTSLPPGGLNLWVRIPDAVDPGRIVRACETAGLLVAPGDEWFPAEAPGSFLRLNYAGPHAPAFAEAARILQRVLEEAAGTQA